MALPAWATRPNLCAALPLGSASPSRRRRIIRTHDPCSEELTDAECRHLPAERRLDLLALIDAQGPVTGHRIVIPADLPVTW